MKSTTEVHFTDIPLKDALDSLEELHHIEIWSDPKVLSEEGLSTDTTVTLVLSGITLRSALRLLLEPLLLTYVIEDEVLKITTITAANEKLTTRVDPVADFLVPIVSPQLGCGVVEGGSLGGGGGGGLGGGLFSVPVESLSPIVLKKQLRSPNPDIRQDRRDDGSD